MGEEAPLTGESNGHGGHMEGHHVKTYTWEAPHSQHEYLVYGERWLQLAIIALSVGWTNALMNVFTAIVDEAKVYYQTSTTAINSISAMWSFLSLPGTLLSFYCMQRYGIRRTLIGGQAATVAGSALCFFSTHVVANGHASGAYGLLFFGSLVSGLVQPCIMGPIAPFAVAWFAAGERDLAITLCTLAMLIGNVAGVAVPPLLVASDASGRIRGLRRFMLGQLAGSAALLLLCCLHRQRPPTPPSASAKESLQAAASRSVGSAITEVRREMLALWQVGSFRLLLTCYGLGLGLINGLFTALGTVLEPCGYTPDQVGLTAVISMGAGLVGSFIAGLVLERTHAYRPVLLVGFVSAPLVGTLMALAMAPGRLALLYGSFGLLGLLCIPILPSSVEAAVETTYPVPEMYSSNVLLMVANYVGVLYTYIFDWQQPRSLDQCEALWQPAKLWIVVSTLAAGLPMLLYRPVYRRTQVEEARVAGCGEAQARC